MVNHGLQGITAKHVGPGRQIADKSFYLADLRQRLQDITSEMQSLEDESNLIEQDNLLFAQHSRKHENMIKEVRIKEGNLADFNLALDKVRTHTDVADVRAMYERVRERNEHERNNVDDVFLRAAAAEKAVKETEERINEHYEKISQRMLAIGEEAQQEYIDLREENNMLNQETSRKMRIMGEVETRIRMAEAELASDAYRVHMRGLELQKLHALLLRQKALLEEDAASGMTGEQLRDRLIRQVKDTNAEIADLELRIRGLEKQLSQLTETVEERESEVMAAKSYQTHAPKYEALFAKEKQINDYVQTFPEAMAAEVANKERLQTAIVALLKHISSQVITHETLPTDASKLEELKADLTFKQISQKQSETTIVIVQKELEKRKEELARVQGLDVKIEGELKELRSKIETMKATSASYKSAEELRSEHAIEKAALETSLQDYKRMRDAMKISLQQANSALDVLERRIQGNSYQKTLVALEKKLATQRTATETIADAIASRKRESDYERIMKESMQIVAELNTLHKAAAAPPPGQAGLGLGVASLTSPTSSGMVGGTIRR